MTKFLIGDLHFGDINVYRMTQRCIDFTSLDEHDATIIKNHNNTVSQEDEVILCGDVGDIVNKPNYVAECLKALHGNITLILGNHDKEVFENKTDMYDYFRNKCGIENIIEYPIIVDDFWMISHEPIYVNLSSPMANIFAHVHDNLAYKTVSPRSYCVSAERILYTPINLEEVKKAVKNCKT